MRICWRAHVQGASSGTRVLRRLAALLVAGCVAACDDGRGDRGSATPLPSSQRLAWSQRGPALSTVQTYRYTLYIDGSPTILSGVTCSNAPEAPPYECSVPLPPLPRGSRVLELSARDPATGLESPRSEPVTLAQTTLAPAATDAGEDVREPAAGCAIGEPTACFTVRAIGTDVGAVRRLRALPDGRLLVLLENGETTMLGSGVWEPIPLGPPPAGARMHVADVAVDPDFRETRFLYTAVVVSYPTGSRTVHVVRLREVNGSLGEAATIVPDLPASPLGFPAIFVGADRRLYVAMPGSESVQTRQGPYEGALLRFNRDGRPAGDARTGSPVLAQPTGRQASLVWDDSGRPHELRWEGVTDLAQGRPSGPGDVHRLAAIGTIPASLRIATLSSKGEALEVSAPRLVSLGSLVPVAATFAVNGDLVVAARHGAGGRVDVLLLQPGSSGYPQ